MKFGSRMCVSRASGSRAFDDARLGPIACPVSPDLVTDRTFALKHLLPRGHVAPQTQARFIVRNNGRAGTGRLRTENGRGQLANGRTLVLQQPRALQRYAAGRRLTVRPASGADRPTSRARAITGPAPPPCGRRAYIPSSARAALGAISAVVVLRQGVDGRRLNAFRIRR